jgi:hypothetical protein
MQEQKKCPTHDKKIHTVCTYPDCSSKLLCAKCFSIHSHNHSDYFADYEDIFGENFKKIYSDYHSQNFLENKTLESEEKNLKKIFNSLISDYLKKIKSFYDQELETFLKEMRENYETNAKVLFNLEYFQDKNDPDKTIECYRNIISKRKEVEKLNQALSEIIQSKQDKFKSVFDFALFDKKYLFTDKLNYSLPGTKKEEINKNSNENENEDEINYNYVESEEPYLWCVSNDM